MNSNGNQKNPFPWVLAGSVTLVLAQPAIAGSAMDAGELDQDTIARCDP